MGTDHVSVASSVTFVLSLLFLMGCEGQGQVPDVPAGQFRAHVEGAVSDTLTGPAYARIEDGALVGLELGPEEEPGLSIELAPHPPALRTYAVVGWKQFREERSEPSPNAVAFLTVDTARFTATDGTIELTYAAPERVGGTFSFEMEGTVLDGPSDDLSVTVTGALDASSEQ